MADVAMTDDPVVDTHPADVDGDETDFVSRVRILPGSTDHAASYEFVDEGHTIGNALRWIIMKNPDVEFCAYSIPHPTENKMNLRIQTYDGYAIDALRKGLKDLTDICDIVTEEFTSATEGQQPS